MGCRFAHEGKVAGWKQRQAVERRSFLKKKTKKLLQIQAEPLRKGRSQLSKSFLFLFFKKEGLPRPALSAAAYLGTYQETFDSSGFGFSG
jgi:hypothetical protein